MQKLLIALLVAAAIAGATLYGLQGENLPAPAYDAWVKWVARTGKQFATPAEEARVQAVWYANYKKIVTFNQGNDETYTMAMNDLMDLTHEEFKAIYLTLKVDETEQTNEVTLSSNIVANDVDWRAKGAVSGVKNQASCGSCWAFSAVGALEGMNKLKSGSMTLFSEQQLVDCSASYGNNGCSGGWMNNAFNYVRDHGITTSGAYAYTGKVGTCKTNTGAFKISGFTAVANSNAGLQGALTATPVSVAVDATNFQFYSSGVFKNCGTSLNHGVTAVGFTATNWIIKNSWGTGWGESGYIRLAMGNTCGVTSKASFPK